MASGNITGPNIGTYNSSVISLLSMRIVIFLDELNNIKIRTSNISNDYLTERMTYNIVFNAGPELATFW